MIDDLLTERKKDLDEKFDRLDADNEKHDLDEKFDQFNADNEKHDLDEKIYGLDADNEKHDLDEKFYGLDADNKKSGDVIGEDKNKKVDDLDHHDELEHKVQMTKKDPEESIGY